jgi:DNA-binding SARP family transcriptional activator
MREATATAPVTLEVSLLGELCVRRAGSPLVLPPSRKTRALLAYLVLTGRPQRRERLCSMFWDVTDDPRGALRWSLSKLRQLVDDAGALRIEADREHAGFLARGCQVDVLSLRRDVRASDLERVDLERLESWAGQFRGELVEGLDLADFDEYQHWCIAEREQARQMRAQILSALCLRLHAQPERALPHARAWAHSDPASAGARVALLTAALGCGRREEAQQHYLTGRRLLGELDAQAARQLEQAWAALQAAPPRAPIVALAAAAPLPGEPSMPLPSFRACIVGRSSESTWLARSLQAVAETSREQICLLTGEPGIGKSTLLAELAASARARGAVLLSGAAFEGETARPYGPWIDGLRGLGSRPEALTADLAPLLPELDRHDSSDGSDSSRARLFAAVSELVARNASAATPMVLVLDDVQWLDRASTELLHYVARSNPQRPVLIVLAARDEELADNAPLARVLRGLRRQGLVSERRVPPLPLEAITELVRYLGAGLPARAVHEQSGGNPLFALELLRGQSPGSDALPSSLARAVRDRLECLPPSAYDVLRWAAVLGSTFSAELLEALLALAAHEVVPALEVLCSRALVVSDAAATGFRFAHEVVRSVVYADLSEPRRRSMHRRIAQALHVARGEQAEADDAAVAEVARHATLGHDDDLAARACRQAGRRCVKMFANEAALSLARRGLRHAEQLQQPARVQRTIELLEVQLWAAPLCEGLAVARELEALGEQALDLDCPEHARLAFFLLGFVTWEGGDWNATRRRMLQLEIISRGESAEARVHALASAGRCLVMLERDLPQAHAMLFEAQARARALDLEPAALLDGLGMIEVHRGQMRQGALLLDRAREIAGALRDHMHEFGALEHTAVMQLEQDDYVAVSSTALSLQRLGDKLREGSEGPFARTVLALARYGLGQGGEQELEAGLQALRMADAKHRLAYALTHAALVDLRLQKPAQARGRCLEALPIARLLDRPSETLLALTLLARAARDLGDTAEHQARLDELDRQDWSWAAASIALRYTHLLGRPLRTAAGQSLRPRASA